MNKLLFHGFEALMAVFVFLLGLFMPRLTRKDIVFGVRWPEDLAAGDDLKNLKRGYFRAYLILGGLLTLGFIALLPTKWSPIAMNADLFGQILIMMILFWTFRARALALKRDLRPMEGRRQVAVADTGDAQGPSALSWAWFAVPLGIAIFNMIYALLRYDAIPESIPMHFNEAGQPDSWGRKSYMLVLFMPLVQIIVTGIVMAAFSAFRSAKRQISVQRSAASAMQNAVFRRRWSEHLIVTNVLIVVMMTVIFLQMIGRIVLTPTQLIAGLLVPIAAILVYSIVLTVKLGQGGVRARVDAPDGRESDSADVRRDDDRFWKAGLFYYNPDDPALWVEKRFGIGYTVNFADRRAYLFTFGIGLLILAVSGLGIGLASSQNPPIDEAAFTRKATPVTDNFFDAFAAGDYERAVRDFSPAMRCGLDAQGLRAFDEATLRPKAGEYESHTFDGIERKRGFVTIRFLAKFTKDDAVKVRIVFAPNAPDFKIQGLWFDSPKLR